MPGIQGLRSGVWGRGREANIGALAIRTRIWGNRACMAA